MGVKPIHPLAYARGLLGRKIKTEEQISEDMKKIQEIMEEIMYDPEIRDLMEENQRKYGTLSLQRN